MFTMFAKNKPKKRIDLPEGNWVELRYLSKGEKDMYRSAVAGVFKGAMKNGSKPEDMSNLPDDFIQRTKSAEYQMISQAIVAWSAGEDIKPNAETVAELDEVCYDLILEAVNEMNDLSRQEEKN
jgi:hypothetical protein